MGESVCCFCIPIRSGTWALAILFWLAGAVTTLLTGILQATGAVERLGPKTPDADEVFWTNITTANAIASLVSGLLNTCLTILLIVAILKNSHDKLRLWLWLKCPLFLAAVVFGIALLVVTVINTDFNIILIALAFAVVTGTEVYFICVVHRYMEILKEEDAEARSGHPAL